MNKLIKQKQKNLLNYQHFLKNDSLKKNKLKLKNILNENPILYKNKDFNIIEINNCENVYIPTTVLDLKNINTIDILYENQQLFNYNLNYNILYNFNKIIFNFKKLKSNIIKGRVITSQGNNKKKIVLISILGRVFSMKATDLNILINNKKDFYKKTKKKYSYKDKKTYYKLKKMRIEKLIRSYKLRYLNFKLEKIENKEIFSRNLYVENLIEYLRIKKKKKIIFLEKIKNKKFKKIKDLKKAIFLVKNMKKNNN